MIDVTFQGGITAIKLKVSEKKGAVTRRCTIVIDREFDDAIAAGLGNEARNALESMRARGMSSCVLPIDGIDAEGLISEIGGESVRIGALKGVKATGTADKEGEFPPSLSLEFEFQFNAEAWAFFGKHCGGYATIDLRQRQLELVGTGKRAKGGKAAQA